MHSPCPPVQSALKQLLFLELDRPVSDDSEHKRVPPSDLQAYRITHTFRLPSCICAYDAPGIDYIESALFRVIGGDFAGEYVAACATNSCNYLSNFIQLSYFLSILTILQFAWSVYFPREACF